MKKIYSFIAVLILSVFFLAGSAEAQLTGTKTIGVDYTTIALAIADLNAVGVGSGGVTFNVPAGYTESITAPLLITATGTSGNPIVFQKSGAGANPVITRTDAGSLTTSTLGGQGDAIIIFQGSDYITFDGISVTASISSIEYGYYLRKASVTDGCKYVTIKNSVITMTKGTSAYVAGIYSSNNDAASLVSSATGITVTSTGGRNESVTIIGNTVQNVHVGILLRGYNHTTSPYDFYDQNFVIGQSGAGNTIQNFAGGSTSTAYGTYAIYHNNINYSYNTLNNTAGSGSAATGLLYGVFNSTGTTSSFTATNNSISLTQSGTTAGLYGINSATTGNLTLNYNSITFSTTATTSGTFGYLYNSSAAASTLVNINNNTFNGSSFATTGSTYLIYNNSSQLTPGVTNIQNNVTSGTINKTSASGAFYCYYNNGSPTGTENVSGNNFSNITLSGTSSFYGINSTTAASHTQNFYNNTISSITLATGTFYGTNLTTANTRSVYGNIIHTISGGGTVYGMSLGSGSTTGNIYKNRIYNISSSAAGALVYGINITSGTLVNIYNNYISDLKATAATGANAVNGIYISGGTTVNLYYNTIYLNATGGATFGSSGIYKSSTTTSEFRNNIIVNVSTPGSTSGNTVAIRWSGAYNAAYYNANSNNNCLYAGTPAINKLIYFDGTNSDQDISAYKTRVASRDAASFSENPPFVNVSSAPYDLHLQTTVPTQCESGGSPVSSPSITDDFDGNIRNVTTPDVGADEGTFTGLDMTAPTISYTALGNTGGTGNRTLTTSITDFSGVPTSGLGLPVLYWKINAGAYSAVTATYISGSTYEFTFGSGVTTGDVVSYYVVAQDMAGTPNVGAYPSGGAGGYTINPPAASTPPTTPSSYIILSAPLSGDYTVGTLLFNKVTGKNITFEKVITKVMKEVPVYEEETKEKEFENKIIGYKQIEVEEISWIPMENGRKFTGDLFIKKTENPNFNYPMGVNGIYATITAAVADLNLRGVSGPVRFLLNDPTYTTGETYPITIDVTSPDLPTATNTVTIKPNTGVTSSISGSSTSSIFKLNGADYIIIDGSNAVSGTTKDLTISNTSTSASTSTIWVASKGTGAGATNNTIKNCIINAGSVSVATTYGIFVGGATIGTTGDDNDNITIQNNTIGTSYIGVYAQANTTGILNNLTITQNTIGSSTDASSVGNIGISLAQGTGGVVSNNEIFNIKVGTNAKGVLVSTGIVSSSFSKNKIYAIRYTGTTGYGGKGFDVSTGNSSSNLTFDNNMIYDITGDGYSGTSDNICGFRLAGGGGYNFYYNSVNLYGSISRSGATADISAAMFIISGVTNLDIRNNIFVNGIENTTGVATAYAIYTTATVNTIFTNINYNDFYVYGAEGVLGYLSSNRSTIADWRTASGQDANSVSSNPQFISNTDLHINTSSPTIVSNAGTPIGSVTTDFDGETRNATTPDIGADEGNFTPLASMVYTSSTTTQVTGSVLPGTTNQQVIRIEVVTTNALNPLTAQQFDVNANGTSDINDVNASTAKIYYTGTSSTFSTSNLFGQEFPTTSPDFSITGSQVLAEGTNYFWLAYDVIPAASNGNFIDGECSIVGLNSGSYTPTVTAPSGYREIVGPMAGTYYVGQGYTSPNFATITAAFADLQTRGVSGAVNLVLTNNAATPYNTTNGETFPLSLNTISGASGTNTITMKPNTGVTPIIQGSSASSIIKLNGTDYFILDGSNSGGTDRSLTIENTNTATTTASVWLASTGVGAGATYNTIKNCNLKTGNIGAAANTFGIFIGGATINSSGSDNDYNTIQNNAISKAYYGIDVWGVSGSTSDNLNITGNTIGSGTATDYITFKGIYISYATSLTISQNTIYNIISSETAILRGIDIGTSVSTATIERNKIYDIQNTTTSGYRSSQGIAIGTGAAGSNISVYNNLLYGFKGHGSGTATNNMWGIILLSGGGYNIYYNSINMYNNGTTSSSTDLNGGLYIASTVTGLDIRNNTIKATGTPGNLTTGYMYGVYCLAANTAFTTINNNDYYVSGTRSMLGFIASTNQATLAAWQSATAQDANSISADPLFASNTDLRPGTTSPLLNAGTPIGSVTTDYLGVTRNATTPTIGAYEQGVDASGPTITYTAIPNTTSTSNVVLTGFAAITDVSGVNVTSGTAPRLYFKKSTDANTYAGNTSGDNGWKWVEASNASTPFDFTIDYGIINGGSVVLNDIIQYFVVAQDLASTPNVGINSGTFAATPTSVDLTAGAFPLTGTINQYKIVGGALSGTYTVGLTAFNKATGKNLYLQTFTRKVSKEVFDTPVTQKQTNKTEISKDNLNTKKTDVVEKDNIIVAEQKGKVTTNVNQDLTTSHVAETDNTTKRFETFVEEYQVIMENGKPYTGDNKIYLNGNGNFRGDEPNGIYSTITAAITDLSERGVSGAVTFSLVDATYPTETYPFVINSVAGVSATNTVTIKPASGVSPTISGASASGPIFKIFNTNYVTIDGSNNGTNSRDLTIENTSTTAPQVILIGSNGTTPITNVTVKNCNIKNGAQTSSAIVVSDGNASGTAGYFNNITIQNNVIKQAYMGLYMITAVAAGNGSGTLVTQNFINNSGTDAIRLVGIYLQGLDGATLSNNNIGNIANTLDASNLTGIWLATATVNTTVSGNNIASISGTAGAPRGIYVSSGNTNANINVTANIVSGLTSSSTGTTIGIAAASTTTGVNISKNEVYNISNTNTSGYTAYGINLASSSATASTNVINNLIYNVYTYGDASLTAWNGYGIYVSSGGGYNIYNNTVSLNTEQTSAIGQPACINIASGVTTLDIRNNVFQNTQTIGTDRYAIICNSANTAFTNINFNNYFSTGTNLGYIGATNRSNLAAWVNGSGQDQYSVSGNSGFTSTTNLTPDPANTNSWVLSGNGTHIATVTDDYTGAVRPADVTAGAPDIGAYEFGVPSVEPNNFNIAVVAGLNDLTINGRVFARLQFTTIGSATSVDVKFYTGKNPPGTSGYPTAQFMNAYYTISPNAGASGFTYNVIYNYSEPQRGTIVNEADIRLAKSDNNGTNWVSYTSQGTGPNMYELNNTTNQITVYGLTAFSTFTNSDVNAPLPVQLSSFNATLKGRDVTLGWKTESEINNAGFDVERKDVNSNEWKKAGYVPGKGTSNSPVNYTFEDKKLNSGKYNYRLKQIDNNGNFTYHTLSTVLDVALPTKFNLSQNYPNPFNPTTKIDFDLPFDSKVNIILYDMTGREVKSLVNDARTAGYYTVQFNASDLSSGTYFYRIMTKSAGGDYMMTKKMMLVK